MKTLLQIGRLAPAVLLALGVGLITGCTTPPHLAAIRATARDPGFPAAPAKVHVVGRSLPNHGITIFREFSRRYGAKSQEKLDERYAAALAAGELWAKREAARIDAHARFAPAVAAEFAARGYTLVAQDEADYTVNFSFASQPWEEMPADGRNMDIMPEAPHDDVWFNLWVDRNPPAREAGRFPLWHGALSAESQVDPLVCLRTLLPHLGRNYAGDTALAVN